VAEDRVVTRGGAPWRGVVEALGLPLVLKTRQSGSSVGVEVARTESEVVAHGQALLETSEYVLCEPWLPGAEFTVPVLDRLDGGAEALPIIEIRPRSAAFFDYEAKYTPGATDEICPAPIPEALSDELARLGLAAHAVLGCSGYSRTDVKLDAEGRPRLLETNTLPGLTPESLFPKAAAAVGMSFVALVERLLLLAMRPAEASRAP
jgi:D-alanine-D-alanine ligase